MNELVKSQNKKKYMQYKFQYYSQKSKYVIQQYWILYFKNPMHAHSRTLEFD